MSMSESAAWCRLLLRCNRSAGGLKRNLARPIIAAVLLALAFPATMLPASPPAAWGKGGAVVSAEAASTEVGLEILRRGGNAADAAVATALAMAVVHPQAGNLGGGGFAVLRFAGTVSSLDFRETAPAASHRDMYLDTDGNPRQDASLIGPLASGIPGSPAGLFELHKRFGSIPWPDVVAPATRLASEGFEVTRRLAKSLEEERSLLARFPETAATWLPGGRVPEAGSTMRIPDLARTLELYAKHGPRGIYDGQIATAIIDAVERHQGMMTADDLSGYSPVWRPALEFESLGWTFAGMDLPSSGGYLVGAALEILGELAWNDHPRFGAIRHHYLVETWRRVFADRAHLGDPQSTKVRPVALIERERLHSLAVGIDAERATDSIRVRGWPEILPREATETVHLSVIDSDGNVVALTTTLNGTFGCGLWVPGAGFLLNNEMDDFSTAPGQPNYYGLVQGPANEVAPGRRMLSSMSPTIGWHGEEIVALGGRGGSRIPTAVAQVLLNMLVDGDGLQAAVDRPRIHHQWLPDHILAEEDALSPETRLALERLGHTIEVSKRGAKVNAARRLADGRFEAAGDPRGPSVGGVVEPLP
jgi:gamma-glutamyltranspeptidase/glutathione hydrolase